MQEQRCYCSDARPLQSDLICSHNTAQCRATHVSCLRDNDGNPYSDYMLGRSCFLCAHCVNRPGFRHPREMECTLDSKYGCFYERKGFAQQRKEAQAAAEESDSAAAGAKQSNGKEVVEVDAAEETEAELRTNGHSVSASRRSTRTTADKDDTPAAATSPAPAASHAPGTAGLVPSSSLSSSSPALSDSTAAASVPALSVDDEPLEPKKGKRRGIREADKKAKAKLIPRCTSPSHFLLDEANTLQTAAHSSSSQPSNSTAQSSSTAVSSFSASAAAASLPSTSASSRHIDKLRTDALLHSIASMYYRPRLVHPSAADVYVSADYDRFEYPTVDALLSPLRQPSVLDEWSPLEVALFEAGICSYGKDFHAIARLMGGRKACGQCVEFYYVWKKSGHYAMWKEFGKPVRRRTDSKAEQWKAVEERMAGLSGRQDEEAGKRRRQEEAEEARDRQRVGDVGGQDKRVKMESSSSSADGGGGSSTSGPSEQASSHAKMEVDGGDAIASLKAEAAHVTTAVSSVSDAVS